MCYTEEQIKQYLEILHTYTKQPTQEADVSTSLNVLGAGIVTIVNVFLFI